MAPLGETLNARHRVDETRPKKCDWRRDPADHLPWQTVTPRPPGEVEEWPNAAVCQTTLGSSASVISITYNWDVTAYSKANERDGGYRLTLGESLAFKMPSVDLVALDDALNELAKLDQQQCRIVEMKFFGGQ